MHTAYNLRYIKCLLPLHSASLFVEFFTYVCIKDPYCFNNDLTHVKVPD